MHRQQNREILAAAYRLIEKYEMPPKVETPNESDQYFQRVADDCRKLCEEFEGNVLAKPFAYAVFEGVEKMFLEGKTNV